MALTARQDRAVVAVTEVTETAGARAESNIVLPVVGAATTEYERAIASLEFILEQGRDQLDPQTVETIEMSLNTIDRAIGEARQALSSDPNNAGLNRLLIKYVQSKLRVLRQASAAIQI
jgi:lipopolysaccharide biosynthesis regulator YciM